MGEPSGDELLGRRAEVVASAPGRVNLIGEHTDYNGGLSLPFAVEQRTTVAAARRADRTLSMSSAQRPDESCSVQPAALRPVGTTRGLPGWARYVAGALWSLREAGVRVGGVDVAVDGRVPIGAGLASSAALCCATVIALARLADTDLTGEEVARLAQRAETGFVGVPCGLMDQIAAMLATAGHAVLFDAARGTTQAVPMPLGDDHALLVIDSRVSRGLANSEYAARRAACEQAAWVLRVPALSDILAGPHHANAGLHALASRPDLVPLVRHVITENDRVSRVVSLLRRGDLVGVGQCLTESHLSLRDDFAVSCPELDTIVEAALAGGALGARLTGGGFGGSVIALVPTAAVDAVSAQITSASAAAGHPAPAYRLVRPSAGARVESET